MSRSADRARLMYRTAWRRVRAGRARGGRRSMLCRVFRGRANALVGCAIFLRPTSPTGGARLIRINARSRASKQKPCSRCRSRHCRHLCGVFPPRTAVIHSSVVVSARVGRRGSVEVEDMGRSAAKRGRGRDSTRTARVMKLMKKPAAGRSGRPVGGKPAGRFVAKRGKLRDSARTIRIMKLMKKPAAGRKGKPVGGKSKVTAPYTLNVAADIKGDPRSKTASKNIIQLATMSDEDLIKFLYEIGFAKDMTGATCPRCCAGTLGSLRQLGGRQPYHQCTAKACRSWVLPWGGCPLLHHGRRSAPLRQQLINLLCLCTNNSVTATIHLTGHSRKSVAHSRSLLLLARKLHAQRVEKSMMFGHAREAPPTAWHDVEVDEASFGKALIRVPRNPEDKVMRWENWIGLVRRGHPRSLMLIRSTNPPTAARSPGPGPITKQQWRSIAKAHLEGRHVVIHTDSARAYREVRIPGTVRDHVVHKKRRIFNKATGKYTWLRPKYVKTAKHRIQGKTITRKAGTQTIDRCWRFLKSRMSLNQMAQPGSRSFAMAVRSAQFEYWTRGVDPWSAMAELAKVPA